MKKSDRKLIRRYRVEDGGKFRLKDHDPADTAGLVLDKDEARRLLGVGVESLAELQGKLYAEDRWALLVIFQAMDAAGKDSTISHVMSGVNPQGCEVFSFKEPSPEELDHDFLWRASQRLPERGRIGIFNRSHYEEVLIVRVHPEILAGEKIPDALVTKRIWDERYEDINAFERHLARNGTAILKFFLNVSKKEQKKRFLARLDDPEKKWKFNLADVQERALWGDYMDAYEEMIRATSTEWAPWYVVPADQKWFTRIVVAGAIVDTLERLGVDYPKVDPAAKRRLAQARRELQKN
ncbi:MAG TPA: polyphosphate kinase 2 family protein [Thermoanaerobaculia bacterium]|nr:polyphosphate kinase 2 family protein [Thermoanaerobaculia bacterium]